MRFFRSRHLTLHPRTDWLPGGCDVGRHVCRLFDIQMFSDNKLSVQKEPVSAHLCWNVIDSFVSFDGDHWKCRPDWVLPRHLPDDIFACTVWFGSGCCTKTNSSHGNGSDHLLLQPCPRVRNIFWRFSICQNIRSVSAATNNGINRLHRSLLCIGTKAFAVSTSCKVV